MKYLSTLFLIVALVGLMWGFSTAVRNSERMLEEAREATVKAHKTRVAKAKKQRRARQRTYQAGIVSLTPAPGDPVLDFPSVEFLREDPNDIKVMDPNEP